MRMGLRGEIQPKDFKGFTQGTKEPQKRPILDLTFDNAPGEEPVESPSHQQSSNQVDDRLTISPKER